MYGCLTSVSNDFYVIGLSKHTYVKCAILNSEIHFKKSFFGKQKQYSKTNRTFLNGFNFPYPCILPGRKIVTVKTCDIILVFHRSITFKIRTFFVILLSEKFFNSAVYNRVFYL